MWISTCAGRSEPRRVRAPGAAHRAAPAPAPASASAAPAAAAAASAPAAPAPAARVQPPGLSADARPRVRGHPHARRTYPCARDLGPRAVGSGPDGAPGAALRRAAAPGGPARRSSCRRPSSGRSAPSCSGWSSPWRSWSAWRCIVWFDRDGYTDNSDGPVDLLDAFYYATVTLSTTGYGDITPVTDEARLVNILVITPLRITFLIILVGTTLEVLTQRTREQLRQNRWRSYLRDHTVVVGYGTKGRSAVRALLDDGTDPAQIVVVDTDLDHIADASDDGLAAVARRRHARRRAAPRRGRARRPGHRGGARATTPRCWSR